MIKNIQCNNTFNDLRSKSQPIIKRDLLRASIISASLLFTVGCNNGSTTSNNQMVSTTAQVAKNLKKDLSLIVPDGAGGLVGIYKPKEEAQFITIGRTSVKNGQPVNKDTMSLIGSTSKMFTALTSLRLIELEILNLDSKLSDYMDSKYFEIFEDQGKAKNITLRQLLSLTSGLQYDTDCDNNMRSGMSLEAILAEMVQKVKNDPSQKVKFTNNPKDHIFSYSNQIWIATIFIEKAYNKYLATQDGEFHNLTYADILQKEILTPLKMKHTGFQKSETDPLTHEPNMLKGFVGKHGLNPAYSFDVKTFDPTMRGTGGLWSTPADLITLAASFSKDGLVAKDGKTLISKSLIHEMITCQGINGCFGLGAYYENDHIGKGGSIATYGCSFEIDFKTGNAVVAMLNFRSEVPSAFDSRAMRAFDELGSIPKPKKTINKEIQAKLISKKIEYEKVDIKKYEQLFVSNRGYLGVNKVDSGLILNWNGSIIVAGSITEQPNQYMIFNEGNNDGTRVQFATGLDTKNPYVFFDNGHDSSLAFKVLTKDDELPNDKDVAEAFNIMSQVHGIISRTYKGIRPDGMPPVTIKLDANLNKMLAKCEEDKYVPILFTKVLKDKNGYISEIWSVGNHTNPPDKIFKFIKKNNDWVLYIAISDNPEKNIEELLPIKQ